MKKLFGLLLLIQFFTEHATTIDIGNFNIRNRKNIDVQVFKGRKLLKEFSIPFKLGNTKILEIDPIATDINLSVPATDKNTCKSAVGFKITDGKITSMIFGADNESSDERMFRKDREKRDAAKKAVYEKIKNSYEILQSKAHDLGIIESITPSSSLDEIHAIFKKLLLAYHPDKGGSVEDMQIINKAWEDIQKSHSLS